MTVLAGVLAAGMDLDQDRIQLLKESVPMRDVGQIGTIAMVILKLGSLTAEERTLMERHTIIGHEIFAGSENKLSQMSALVALTHHECFDGSGYPHGLVGDQIPIEGRIAAVADVFNALLSRRAYRGPLSVEEAVLVMKEGRNSRFDPMIVDLLLRHLGMN